MVTEFTLRAIRIIGQIPPGKVITYGMVAQYAGNPSGARQVSRILHSSSGKYDLPWHRVVNRKGQISPRSSMSHLLQQQKLIEEGVVFDKYQKIDFSRFLWWPSETDTMDL